MRLFPSILRQAAAALLLVCPLLAPGGSPPLWAGTRDLLTVSHKGMQIQAVSPDPDTRFDVSLVPGPQAVEKIKAALDLIFSKSPVHARALDDLTARGTVILVYNPNYPAQSQDLARVKVALFIPFYLDRPAPGAPRTLPVVISRHGIKWPTPDLAAVMVHELAGHGQQYLDGLTDTMRPSELECQAYLHQELAHQALGMDKSDRKMIQFRQQLSGIGGRGGVCTPFFTDLQRRTPDKVRLFERLDPDVPRLLPLLDRFIRDLAENGTTQKALALQKEMVQGQLDQMAARGTPRQLYGTGLYLLEGAGYRQDLARGADFIRQSARKNFPEAQAHLARLYLQGRGLPRDVDQAYFWLTLAARSATGPERQKILASRRSFSHEITAARRASLEAEAGAWPL